MSIAFDDSYDSSLRPPVELVEFAARVGCDPMLIQGGGGNLSAKMGDILWIKGSGKWLSSAREEPIFAAVRLSGVRDRMAAGEPDPATPELLPISPENLRPSIETSMHALLPHAITAHVHSVNSIALTVCAEGIHELETRLEGLRWTLIPYVRPGIDLTNILKGAMATTPVDVVVLANHGLVVGGPSCLAVEELLEDVETRLALPARASSSPDIALLDALCANTPYCSASDPLWHAMAIDPRQRTIAIGGALYPDHVVFLGPAIDSLNDDWDTSLLPNLWAQADYGAPRVLLVPGAGVLHRNDISAGARAMVGCLARILARIPAANSIHYLSLEEVSALLNWGAEKYRLSLEASSGRTTG